MITFIEEDFGQFFATDPEQERWILKNNAPGVWWKSDLPGRKKITKKEKFFTHTSFLIHTDETWLPKILVDAGFFESGNQVKKNRFDLWRDVEEFEDVVKLKWATIFIEKK